jgi:membrane-bound serine protease (ClpP class)
MIFFKQNTSNAFVLKKLVLSTSVLFSLHFMASAQVYSIAINGGINPASAEFIQQSIEQAETAKVNCLIIKLNTPGGLSSSTRDIVSSMLQSKVPVVVYVSPTGAHAGSAGVFITMAANVASMAPGTNIGAAHPVNMQGKYDAVMMEKGTNDAAAFIRTVAEKRGRNAEWAEDAVRRSVAITETEALQNNVINLIAENEADLLQQIDQMQVKTSAGQTTLHTKDATVKTLKMGFFQSLLDLISNPDIAYVLMMLGFFGLLFELFNPGALLPGIAGVIFLILAFYAMSSMPVNYAGVALIVFGIILFLLEIKIVSHGMLALGGIVSLLAGSIFLFRSSPTEDIVSLSWSVMIATTAVTALFFLFVVGMGLKAQKTKPVSGSSAAIGQKAIALSNLSPEGQVSFMGEIWNAVSLSNNVSKNKEVVIREVKNLTLLVEPTAENTDTIE